MMAAVNPDIEVLDVDEDRGLVKVREKKTGKTLTLNFEDLKKGKIVVKTNEGEEVAVGGKWEPPDWVPSYPGVTMNTTVRAKMRVKCPVRFLLHWRFVGEGPGLL
jgi:hypothetical protein